MTLRLDPISVLRHISHRLADWILRASCRWATRRKHPRRSRRRFHQHHSQAWYWQQTLRLTLRYLFSPSPQDKLDLFEESRHVVRSGERRQERIPQYSARAPGTSALIVLTLAFAIGAATIGFTFAALALLRGLPVDDPSKVVSVFANDQQGSNPRARISGPDFLDYRRAQHDTRENGGDARFARAADPQRPIANRQR